MRRLLLLLLFVSPPAWAQSRFRIEPPLPDSATAFTISGTGPAEVAVSVAPFALHQRAILDTTLTLTPVDGSADLAEASLDITAQPESLAIFCAPQGPQRIWAFVSITNNETQHVTVVSPE